MSDNEPKNRIIKIIVAATAIFTVVIAMLSQLKTIISILDELNIGERVEVVKSLFDNNDYEKRIDKDYISINSTSLWEDSEIGHKTQKLAELPRQTILRVIAKVNRKPVYSVEYNNIRGYVLSDNFLTLQEFQNLKTLENEKFGERNLEKLRLNTILPESIKGDENPKWISPNDVESYFWFPKHTKIQALNSSVMVQYDAPHDNANVLSTMATQALSFDLISRWGGDGKWYAVPWNNHNSYIRASEAIEVWPASTKDEQDREYIPNYIALSDSGNFIAFKEDNKNPSLYRYYIALSACPIDICNYGLLRVEINFLSSNVQRNIYQIYPNEWGNYYIPMILSLPKKYENSARINMYLKKCAKISGKCQDKKIYSNQK